MLCFCGLENPKPTIIPTSHSGRTHLHGTTESRRLCWGVVWGFVVFGIFFLLGDVFVVVSVRLWRRAICVAFSSDVSHFSCCFSFFLVEGGGGGGEVVWREREGGEGGTRRVAFWVREGFFLGFVFRFFLIFVFVCLFCLFWV